MKKIFAMLMMCAMLLMLAACGNNQNAVVPTENNGGSGGSALGEKIWREFSKDATTPETVLNVENGCSITIAPVEYLDDSLEFTVTLSNPTQEVVNFRLAECAVNKVMCEAYFYEEVEAGSTMEAVIDIAYGALRPLGVFQLAMADLQFSVTDEEYEQIQELTAAIKSDKAESYQQDTNAVYNIFTDENALQEMDITVKDIQKLDKVLGNNVKLISQSIYTVETGSVMMMEFYNAGPEARYVDWYVTALNGLPISANPDWGTILPGCRWVMCWHIDSYVSEAKQQAFGIESVAKVDYYVETSDADYENYERKDLAYAVPNEEVTLDLSGTVVYDDNGLKITMKESVATEYGSDIIYLIFDAEEDVRLEPQPDNAVIDGEGEDVWCDFPYWITKGEMVVGQVSIDDLDADSVTIPVVVTLEDTYGNEEMFTIQLKLPT